jgi:hypothetical protein
MKRVNLARRKDEKTLMGRCPICGDSKKDQSRTRFYLVRANSRYPDMVYCHNCFYKKPADSFFRSFAPDEVKHLEELQGTDEGLKGLFEQIKEYKPKTPEEIVKDLKEELVRAKKVVGSFFKTHTYPIENFDEALEYVKSRFIPDEWINKLRLLKPQYHSGFRYAYLKDYIIFPFFDKEDDKPYYFHSRRFRNLENERMAKYLSCPYRPENDVTFYLNEFNVDEDGPVYICEGTIDSLHIPNSIATNGVGKISEEFLEVYEHRFEKKNLVFCLDNEIIDTDARNKAIELYNKGYWVFAWSELIKDFPFVKDIKDFNSLCCAAKKTEFPIQTLIKYVRKK